MSFAALAQTAICPAMHAHGLFIAFDAVPGSKPAATRLLLAQLAERLDAWASTAASQRNVWAIGIGSAYWDTLQPAVRPRELAPFPEFADAVHSLAVQPYALFLHLRSEGADQCYLAGQLAQALLGTAFTLAEATAGFRYLDQRDLTGFVDGTENPPEDERAAVALVDDDGAFNGGSYLHVQRYVHEMRKWQQLPVAAQEQVIGRSKEDDVELDDAHKPADAHIARVVIEEGGAELEIVRQSMPYGALGGEAGLMFLSYCKTPTTFSKMLQNMFTRRDGHSDHLLQFTRAVSSAAYFMPPRPMLASWAL